MTRTTAYEVAGWYCEHQGLGHTCQSCADVVADVFSAARDAGLTLHRRPCTHNFVRWDQGRAFCVECDKPAECAVGQPVMPAKNEATR